MIIIIILMILILSMIIIITAMTIRIRSTMIANTFLALGAKIQSKQLEIGHEFPKLSRDVINDWMTINN